MTNLIYGFKIPTELFDKITDSAIATLNDKMQDSVFYICNDGNIVVGLQAQELYSGFEISENSLNTVLDYLDPEKQIDKPINIFMTDIVPVVLNFWHLLIKDLASKIDDTKILLSDGGIPLEVDHSHLDVPDSLDFQLYYFEEK